MDAIVSKLFANAGARLHVRTQKGMDEAATDLQTKAKALREKIQSMNRDTATISEAGRAKSQAHTAAATSKADADAMAAEAGNSKANVPDSGSAASTAESASASATTRKAEAATEAKGSPTVDTAKSAEQAKFDTREAKDAEGARFDAILAELRGKYDEKEAMSRFNDFMRSEGYEVLANVEDGTKPPASGVVTGGQRNGSIYLGGSTAFKNGWPTSRIGEKQGEHGSSQSAALLSLYTNRDARFANFTTSSTVTGKMVNGEMQYTQATWASYNAAVNSVSDKDMEFWKNRNVEELSAKAGFDVGEYADSFSLNWGKAFAAESVSADLGSVMTDLLGKAGITLEPGNDVSLFLNYAATGKANGLSVNINFGDAALRDKLQSVIDSEVKKNPGILKAFEKESNSVAEYDVSKFAGNFSDGVQANAYTQQRQFAMSGSQPSVVVMGSGIDAVKRGYTYVKKISDTFDANADLVAIRGRDYTTESDPNEYAAMKKLDDKVAETRA